MNEFAQAAAYTAAGSASGIAVGVILASLLLLSVATNHKATTGHTIGTQKQTFKTLAIAGGVLGLVIGLALAVSG